MNVEMLKLYTETRNTTEVLYCSMIYQYVFARYVVYNIYYDIQQENLLGWT